MKEKNDKLYIVFWFHKNYSDYLFIILEDDEKYTFYAHLIPLN